MQSLYNAMFGGHYIWVFMIRHQKIADPYLFTFFLFIYFFGGWGEGSELSPFAALYPF